MSPSSPAEKIATNTTGKGMAVLRSVDCDRGVPAIVAGPSAGCTRAGANDDLSP
jgi:hypothetical protein